MMDNTRMYMTGRVTKDKVGLARKILVKFYYAPHLGIDVEFLARLFSISETQIRRILREIKTENKDA